MRNFKLFPISAIIAIVILGSCKKDKDPLDNMTMAFDSESYEIHENEDFALYKHLTITPESVADTVTVDWSSSDENIVYVKKAGRVTGVVCGEATVTATSYGKSASCKIIVKEIPIESFSIPAKMRIPDGVNSAIDVNVYPQDASAAHITWTSTVPEVKPFYDGEWCKWCIQTDYIGDVVLTATYGSLEPKTCNMTVYDHTKIPVTGFYLSWNTSPKVTVNINSTVKVYAYDIKPDNANYSEISFSVDKPELATLSKPIYDSSNKQYYCLLNTGNKAGHIVVTAQIRDEEMLKKTVGLFIEKIDIESVSLPEKDIVSFQGGSTFMGQQGYTLTPSDAKAENVTYTIEDEDGIKVPESVMNYTKSGKSYYLNVGSSAPVGRYSVVANADGVLSEPMYVNVITEEWIKEQIDKQMKEMEPEQSIMTPYNDGYLLTRFGTIGMRDKISPRDMFYQYKTIDQSLKNALWMTFDGITDNSQRAFYMVENYKTGMQMTDGDGNRVEYDFPFQKTTVGDGKTIRKGTFQCTFYVGPVNNKTISMKLYFEVYSSYLRMYRVRTDINGKTSRSDLNYKDDCMCVGAETSGGQRYQDAVDLYIEYARNVHATAGVTRAYHFWWTELNTDGSAHSWNVEFNAFPVDLQKTNKNSKLPVSEGRDIHLTIRFHGAQHAECTYDPDPEHPQ